MIKKNFFCLPEIDRKGITDSLLLESGTVVCRLETDTFSAELRVCGEVRIIWKGEVFRYPSDFPEDLVEAIRNGSLDSCPDAEVCNNNWYELFVNDDDPYSDVIDIDIDAMSDRELEEMLAESIAERNAL